MHGTRVSEQELEPREEVLKSVTFKVSVISVIWSSSPKKGNLDKKPFSIFQG